jgi:competence protein ComEA
VADVIVAAGGALPGADLGGVNLAARVADGQRLAVPGTGGGAASPAPDPDGAKVAVNSAAASELEALPGVGPVLAERIVAHRERHGPFGVVEDLLDVPGIGEGKLAALRDSVQIP